VARQPVGSSQVSIILTYESGPKSRLSSANFFAKCRLSSYVFPVVRHLPALFPQIFPRSVFGRSGVSLGIERLGHASAPCVNEFLDGPPNCLAEGCQNFTKKIGFTWIDGPNDQHGRADFHQNCRPSAIKTLRCAHQFGRINSCSIRDSLRRLKWRPRRVSKHCNRRLRGQLVRTRTCERRATMPFGGEVFEYRFRLNRLIHRRGFGHAEVRAAFGLSKSSLVGVFWSIVIVAVPYLRKSPSLEVNGPKAGRELAPSLILFE